MRFLQLSLVVWLAAPAFAGPRITVTAPIAGAQWCTGQTYTVTWSSPGTTANVAIQLALPRGVANTLVPNTKDDGVEDVTVPATLEPGSYVVRVRTVSRPVLIGESHPISVARCVVSAPLPPQAGVMPSITVTQPRAGARLVVGNLLPVALTAIGPVPDTPLTISLETPGCGREVRVLRSATANDGEESVVAPADLPEGDYSVKIGIFGSRIQACSGTFRLVDVVSIFEPSRATTVHSGDRLTVRWRSSLGGTLRLALTSGESLCRPATTLASSTPNDGEAVVVVPADTLPGYYRLVATPIDPRWGDTCFSSETFRVVAPSR